MVSLQMGVNIEMQKNPQRSKAPLNRHKKQHNTIFLEDNGFISDPTKVSNKFNDFFLNIAEKLSAKIENKSSKPQDYLKNPNKS